MGTATLSSMAGGNDARDLAVTALRIAATSVVVLGLGALVQLDPLADLDASLYDRADDGRVAVVTRAMRTITQLGDFPVSYGALIAAGVLLGLQRSSWRIAVLPVTAGAAQHAISAAVARLLDPPIPSGPDIIGNPGNFPSGGAARAVLWVGLVLYLATLDRARSRRLLVVVTAVGAVAESASRFYLGLHFPFDLVGGVLLGAGLLLAFAALAARWHEQGKLGSAPGSGQTALAQQPAPVG